MKQLGLFIAATLFLYNEQASSLSRILKGRNCHAQQAQRSTPQGHTFRSPLLNGKHAFPNFDGQIISKVEKTKTHTASSDNLQFPICALIHSYNGYGASTVVSYEIESKNNCFNKAIASVLAEQELPNPCTETTKTRITFLDMNNMSKDNEAFLFRPQWMLLDTYRRGTTLVVNCSGSCVIINEDGTANAYTNFPGLSLHLDKNKIVIASNNQSSIGFSNDGKSRTILYSVTCNGKPEMGIILLCNQKVLEQESVRREWWWHSCDQSKLLRTDAFQHALSVLATEEFPAFQRFCHALTQAMFE